MESDSEISIDSFDSAESIDEDKPYVDEVNSAYLGSLNFLQQNEEQPRASTADTSKEAHSNSRLGPRKKLDLHFHADNSQYGFSKTATIAGEPVDLSSVMLTQICEAPVFSPCFKVTIFGAGKCAGALAFLLLSKGITGEVVLYDVEEARNKLTALTLDLMAASPYYPLPVKINSTHDLEDTNNSKVYVYTPDLHGMKSNNGSYIDSDLTNSNISIMQESLEHLKKSATENSIILNYAKSGDIMEYAIWKYTNFEPHRIVGVGTNFSAAYLRNYMARKFKCSESECIVTMTGMEGTNLVPIWTSISICGARLMDANPEIGLEEGDEWTTALHEAAKIHLIYRENSINEMKNSNVSKWGAAVIMSAMINAIINNTKEMFLASTFIPSCRHGTSDGVFMSLPCVLGCNGVSHLIKEVMTQEEQDIMSDSAEKVLDKIKQLNLPGEAAPASTTADEVPVTPSAPLEENLEDDTLL